MVIGLLCGIGRTGPDITIGNHQATQQLSDSGSSKDPVVRLSQLLGQTSLDAECQHSFKKSLELAAAAALAVFDRVGYLESLAVCTDEEKALLRFQERHACALEALSAWLAQHCTTLPLPPEQQQQLDAARTNLEAALCDVAAAATQQVRATAAAAAARSHFAAAGAAGLKAQQQAAGAAALQAFKGQLLQLEDSCRDVAAAQQACKAATDKHLKAFRGTLYSPSSGTSTSSSTSSRISTSGPASVVLLLKAELDKHTAHVLDTVRHRAAALACETRSAQLTWHQKEATASAPDAPAAAPGAVANGQHGSSSSSSTAAVLQQAQPARAARLQKDRHALQQAVQQAIQLMHQAVLQLQQQSFPNIFVAGKAAEEACTSAHTHFVHLAAQQHSCAPDCPEYQTQLLAVEAAVDQGREQLMAALQAAAAATAVPGG